MNDIFGSNDMEDMDKVVRDMIIPGTHLRLFCFALKFSVWYKCIASKENKGASQDQKISEEVGFESKDSESIELL